MAYVFETIVGQGDDKMINDKQKRPDLQSGLFCLSEVKLPEMFGTVVIG